METMCLAVCYLKSVTKRHLADFFGVGIPCKKLLSASSLEVGTICTYFHGTGKKDTHRKVTHTGTVCRGFTVY